MKTILVLSCVVLAVIAVEPSKKTAEKEKRQIGDNLFYYNALPHAYNKASLVDHSALLDTSAQYYNTPLVKSEATQYTVQNGIDQFPVAQYYSTPLVKPQVIQHTVHNVINKVPVAIPQPVAVPITKTVKVAQPYPVHVEKPLPVQVRVNVPYPVDKPYPVHVPHQVPYQVRVKVPYAVEKPYPVTITKTVPVAVEKPVYVKVPEIVKVPVEQPYPVPVQRKVAVTVPEPVVVKVPELINVRHNIYKQPVIQQQEIEQITLPVYNQQVYGQEYRVSGLQPSEFISADSLPSLQTLPYSFAQNQNNMYQMNHMNQMNYMNHMNHMNFASNYGTYGMHNIVSRDAKKENQKH
ncbi:uncharacterized protein [Diabrotica undecimpunctata]|uniref:uncharacterized protein n=1 Tax=Diabrotica undecimpunctata TaxID=50387 RepID=UPI003B63FE9C